MSTIIATATLFSIISTSFFFRLKFCWLMNKLYITLRIFFCLSLYYIKNIYDIFWFFSKAFTIIAWASKKSLKGLWKLWCLKIFLKKLTIWNVLFAEMDYWFLKICSLKNGLLVPEKSLYNCCWSLKRSTIKAYKFRVIWPWKKLYRDSILKILKIIKKIHLESGWSLKKC